MICLAASCPALASRTPRFSAVGIDGQDALDERVRAPGADLGVVGPAELDRDDGLVRVGFLPGGRHLGAHLEGDPSLVAASRRDARVGDGAEERGHDDARIDGVVHARRRGLGVPDVQRGGVEAPGVHLVDVLGHDGRVRLPIEDHDLRAVLLLRVALRLRGLGLVEHVRQVGHEERDPLGLRLGRGGRACRGQRDEANRPVASRVFRFILLSFSCGAGHSARLGLAPRPAHVRPDRLVQISRSVRVSCQSRDDFVNALKIRAPAQRRRSR